MSRQPAPPPPVADPQGRDASDARGAPGRGGVAREAPSLSGLGIAGVSRRRIAVGVAALAAAWIVVAFAGQAAEAAGASARLAREAAVTAEIQARTEALREELRLVREERWVLQQARGYQLGSRKERPIALAPDAPPLPPDAPGSLARQLGAEVEERSPLDAWLDVLFGPAGG